MIRRPTTKAFNAKEHVMKRLIAAVSFAALAVPAFAAEPGLPYSQDQVDRALPNVEVHPSSSAGAPAQ
jgi:hypothetical protein